ncbi:DEKNAAC104718 [Brettanomyces naardenensis]|uniref:Ureidoglycolate lyase n=1 Tax=Brettanomyces naardenensis TaxID=13370 RepID=A0A448YR34_BRENA|nr:DEKNAAC104718 [Brettanomyces naardenensis]
MVVIRTVQVGTDVQSIKAIQLTPESFAKFGAVFSADEQMSNVSQTSANQGTATKLLKVAPVTNNSDAAPSGKRATANWNIFRCSPPNHLIRQEVGHTTYLAKVLERHPYTTQTFVPMGRDAHEIGFLVICAPDDPVDHLPDFTKAEAFLCRGDQSVTYGVATWHAPMIVIGPHDHLDFAVLVHESGVPEEDCQEVTYEPGFKVLLS